MVQLGSKPIVPAPRSPGALVPECHRSAPGAPVRDLGDTQEELVVADHRNRHATTDDQVPRDPSAAQTDTVKAGGGRPAHSLSLENLHELAVRLRRGLGRHVAAGLLTVAEANDMVARVDGLIAHRSRPGGNGRTAVVPP